MDFPVGSTVNNCTSEELAEMLNIKPIECYCCTKNASGATKEVPQAELTIFDEVVGEVSMFLCTECKNRVSAFVLDMIRTERTKLSKLKS